MSRKPFWLMRQDAESFGARSRYLDQDISNGVGNLKELNAALFDLLHTRPISEAGDRRIPDGFMRPEVQLPTDGFAPDYLKLSGLEFVSRRFRDALAQPDGVVQYWPIDLARGSGLARAQDYKLLRILAWQPALDWERSDCERHEITNRLTGERTSLARFIKRFVPSEGLEPVAEIFRVAESPPWVLVTDGLAERMLRASCTGVSFREPESIGMYGQPQAYRTATGIGVLNAEKVRVGS